MRIRGIRTIDGPNVWHHRPVLVMRLDLEDLVETDSAEIPGFIDRLLALVPDLRTHACSVGREGGFVERLHRGTYMAHIVEHVALALSEPAGIGVGFGKARHAGEPGVYNVVVRYRAEQGMKHLLRSAVDLVQAAIAGEPFDVSACIDEARSLTARTELGPSTKAIVDAARRRGIPTRRLNDASLVQLGYGKHRRLIQAAMSDQSSAIAVEIAGDKHLAKELLERVSVPVPRGTIVTDEEEAVAALEEVGAPVVVKPLDGRQGKGVTVNLSTPEEVRCAFRIAERYSPDVIVEQFLAGRNYRLLVVGGRLVAANERKAACVTGDGVHTVAELMAIANQDPRRGEGHEAPLTRLEVDSVVEAFLAKSGRTLTDVPLAGEEVFLRESANLSTGGTAADVTDRVHPSVRRACERAARTIGLDICGIDLVMADITQPLREGEGGIIELNAAPGLRMHQFPSEGTPRDAGAAIVDTLYPPGTPSRIPIVAITGTNGKTTVTRMVNHIWAATGLTIGMTTTEGIYIDGELIVEGDTSGPASAQTVLSDPAVEAAVLETARGGMMRAGLGWDWCDVGIVTNIQLDHIGQDSLEGIEDIVEVKALVAERVRDGGTLVLNADDEHVVGLLERPHVREGRKHVVFFSLSPENAHIRRHVERGGTAYYLEDGWIVEARDGSERRIVQAARIPVTLGGTAHFHIANTMAAVAACRAAGMEPRTIATALLGFRGDVHNPGRGTMYRVGHGSVLVDFGHNPHAFAAVSEMARRWHGSRVTGIVSVPGDRADWLIEEAARVAARGFDRVIVRSDHDLRGRRQGEVAELICRAIRQEVPTIECAAVQDECEAFRQALDQMQPDELVVLFYEHDLPPVLEILRERGAVPAVDEPAVAQAEVEDTSPAVVQGMNGHRGNGRADLSAAPVSQRSSA